MREQQASRIEMKEKIKSLHKSNIDPLRHDGEKNYLSVA